MYDGEFLLATKKGTAGLKYNMLAQLLLVYHWYH